MYVDDDYSLDDYREYTSGEKERRKYIKKLRVRN